MAKPVTNTDFAGNRNVVALPVLGSVRHQPRPRSSAWKAGESGNPAGRPKGSRNRVHVRLLELLASQGESVLQAVITAAKAGDMVAAKLVLDRALPRRMCAIGVELTLPPLRTASDIVQAMSSVFEAVVDGHIPTSEAATLCQMLQSLSQTINAADFEERLSKLESHPTSFA